MKKMILLSLCLAAFPAYGIDCPEVGDPVEKSTKRKIDTSIGKLANLTGGSLEAVAETETRSLLPEIKNSDRVFLTRIMLGGYCSSLRSNKKLDETEKGERFRHYSCGVMRGIGQDPGPSCEKPMK